MKKQINTIKAPGAIGPYSQAIESNGMVFISGQLGINPETSTLQEGVEAQTKQAMENMKAILDEAGLTFANVVKTTILVQDLADFATINEIYGSFLAEPFPARATFQVAKLPLSGLVEIEAIAVK